MAIFIHSYLIADSSKYGPELSNILGTDARWLMTFAEVMKEWSLMLSPLQKTRVIITFGK